MSDKYLVIMDNRIQLETPNLEFAEAHAAKLRRECNTQVTVSNLSTLTLIRTYTP